MKITREFTAALCATLLLAALACSGQTGGKSGREARGEPAGKEAGAAGQAGSSQGEPQTQAEAPAQAAGAVPATQPPSAAQTPVPPQGPAAASAQAPAAAPVPSQAGAPQKQEPANPAATTLPPGHPPIENPPGEAAGKEAPEGAALAWKVPAKWKEERPSSRMRRAQYRVPGVDGDPEDAQCVVFYFGPGQGGTPESNAMRWVDQFKQPDGSSSQKHSKIEMRTVSGKQTMFVEVKGTYQPMAMPGMPAQGPKEGYALIGAIVSAPDAPWFFKLTGPARTVEANRAAFEAMIASIG